MRAKRSGKISNRADALRAIGNSVLVGLNKPGREWESTTWYVESPYAGLDGRTVAGLIAGGYVSATGGNRYEISPKGRKAVA